jgi:hypothetical protein
MLCSRVVSAVVAPDAGPAFQTMLQESPFAVSLPLGKFADLVRRAQQQYEDPMAQ